VMVGSTTGGAAGEQRSYRSLCTDQNEVLLGETLWERETDPVDGDFTRTSDPSRTAPGLGERHEHGARRMASCMSARCRRTTRAEGKGCAGASEGGSLGSDAAADIDEGGMWMKHRRCERGGREDEKVEGRRLRCL